MKWIAIVVALVVVAVFMLGGRKDVTEAKQLAAAGARIVDVRTAGEYASGHIDGAVNVPVDVIGGRLKDVGPKDEPVIVYCRSGARSARAKRLLEAAGYTKVVDIGSISNWK